LIPARERERPSDAGGGTVPRTPFFGEISAPAAGRVQRSGAAARAAVTSPTLSWALV